MKVSRKEQVFETRVKPTSEETYRYLKGYRPPRTAYVLFEKQEFKVIGGDGEIEYGTGLFTLNVEHRPEQIAKINQYLGKGFKVLHYDNFPGVHHTNSVRMAKAKLYSQGENQKNPWEELQAHLDASIENNPHWRSEMAVKDERLAAAELKAAELERRMAEMEAKLKKKDQDKDPSKDKEPNKDTKGGAA